jgi:hypothetical protein
MIIDSLCPPAVLYLGFSIIQILIDLFRGQQNSAFLKIVVMIVFTILLNQLCMGGLTLLSWFIVFIPFIMMTYITTILLYFKAELHGVTHGLTRKDLVSIFQFAVLSVIILPILPDINYGPFETLNPHQTWLMVVLVSGVSLAGYLALRIVGERYGAPLLGRLGGLGAVQIVKPTPGMGFDIRQRLVLLRQIVQRPCQQRVLLDIGQISGGIDMLIRQHRDRVTGNDLPRNVWPWRGLFSLLYEFV